VAIAIKVPAILVVKRAIDLLWIGFKISHFGVIFFNQYYH
jgi:hypothetical protein